MPSSQVADPDPALHSLLLGFRSRQPEPSEAFFEAVSSRLKATARRYLPDLPDDIQSEVVGETLLLLLQPNMAPFDASRGSAWNYIHGFALNAVSNVRSMYGRKRIKKKGETEFRVSAIPQHISFEELGNGIPVKDPTVEYHEKIAAAEVLAKAPLITRFALERIYFDQQPRVRVAAELKIDRFALQRQLVTFANSFTETHVGA
jgi:hypothetical protein